MGGLLGGGGGGAKGMFPPPLKLLGGGGWPLPMLLENCKRSHMCSPLHTQLVASILVHH